MNADESRARHVDVPTSRVFVGRQREIGILHATLAEAIAGSGRCVMLAGEPGIGKTRICQEIVAYAGEQGALALYGRCLEQSEAVPYWPWVQVLRTHACANVVAQLHAEINGPSANLSNCRTFSACRLRG